MCNVKDVVYSDELLQNSAFFSAQRKALASFNIVLILHTPWYSLTLISSSSRQHFLTLTNAVYTTCSAPTTAGKFSTYTVEHLAATQPDIFPRSWQRPDMCQASIENYVEK